MSDQNTGIAYPHAHLSSSARRQLVDLELKLLSLASWNRALERVFTADERQTIEHELAKVEQQESAELEGVPDSRWRVSPRYQVPNYIQWYMNVRHVSGYRATIELGYQLGFVDIPTRDWLLRETGEASEGDEPIGHTELNPRWDKHSSILYFGTEVARQIKRPTAAKNIIAILDAFEEEGWTKRVDDPLPGGRDQKRLAATVESLNSSLLYLKFSQDGTGEGINWSLG